MCDCIMCQPQPPINDGLLRFPAHEPTTLQYPKFNLPETDDRTPMMKVLEILETLSADERDRILLSLANYYGHTVEG